MPSYCIHVAHGLKTLEVFQQFLSDTANQEKAEAFQRKYPLVFSGVNIETSTEWKKLFLAGLIFPDAAKLSEHFDAYRLDRMMHYPQDTESYFKTPDMNQFLKEHPLDFNDPFYFGYALHLYLDVQYDSFMKGMFTLIESSPKRFIYIKNDEDVIVPEEQFWKQIYDDYTFLNPYYVNLYNFSIDDFANPCIIRPRDAGQISWYQKLYCTMEQQVLASAIDIIHNNNIEAQKSQTVLIDFESMDALIYKAANDFFDIYLRGGLEKCWIVSTVSPTSISNNSEESDRKLDKWSAEKVKLRFYEARWKQLVDKGCVYPEEIDFFKGVLTELQDVTCSAAQHKKLHESITDIICKLPVLITIFSALATSLSVLVDQTIHGKWVVFILGSVSTLSSACLAAVNEYEKRSAHRETWLRQRLFYSKLMDETEAFCEKLGKYEEISDRATVKTYMNEIRLLRKKDYENFFSNMGCSNYHTDGN